MNKNTQRKEFFKLIRALIEGMRQFKHIDARRTSFLKAQASVMTAEVCGIINHRAAVQILEIANFYKMKEE